jgi:hypothetical protein
LAGQVCFRGHCWVRGSCLRLGLCGAALTFSINTSINI